MMTPTMNKSFLASWHKCGLLQSTNLGKSYHTVNNEYLVMNTLTMNKLMVVIRVLVDMKTVVHFGSQVCLKH